MATTYNPNDTDCTGWDGYDAARPAGALAMDTELVLSGAELNIVSVDDVNSISCEGGGYPGHHFRLRVPEAPNSITQIVLTVKGYAQHNVPPDYEYYLYIWKGTVWEAVDNHTTGSKDTMTGVITTNCADYVHDIAGKDYIDILAMGPVWHATGSAYVWTYYAEVVVTGVIPASSISGVYRGPFRMNTRRSPISRGNINFRSFKSFTKGG